MAEDIRISLRMWDAGLDILDFLSAEASRSPLMLGPGKTRTDRTFQLRNWSTCGRFPRSGRGSHWHGEGTGRDNELIGFRGKIFPSDGLRVESGGGEQRESEKSGSGQKVNGKKANKQTGKNAQIPCPNLVGYDALHP